MWKATGWILIPLGLERTPSFTGCWSGRLTEKWYWLDPRHLKEQCNDAEAEAGLIPPSGFCMQILLLDACSGINPYCIIKIRYRNGKKMKNTTH